MRTKEITLVGGGLAGCLLAVFLARRRFPVRVFERLPDMRKHRIPAGRSINLSLSTRGIHALKEVGLYREIEKHLVAMPGRMIHDQAGNLLYQPYGRDESAVHFSVERAVLNKILLDAAEAAGTKFFFGEGCEWVDFENRRLLLRRESDDNRRALPFATVIGTDGAGSAIRHAMIEQKGIDCRDEHLPHGYKELAIPPGPDGAPRLEKNALHIWPRGGFMLIALPNRDGSFTATLFLPHSGSVSFRTLTDERAILRFLETEFPDVLPLMANPVHDFLNHPTGTLGTIRCFPWHVADQALLLGDAAHAVVPFHGQGMNCAFEDCVVLDRLLDEHKDLESLYLEFETRRKPDAEAIADMALENYVEMRDSVRDPKFHLRKHIEWLLEERHPGRFIPRYAMVMFHRIPYAVAKNRGDIEARIIDRLSESIERVEDVDLGLADRLVLESLEPLASLTEYNHR
ncbi:NAD(P)/FAD-dependent oxidoreductase [Methylocaldum sp.]|uniref:FAD-dependent oxidoreductase n=1 Tax=Methylocaldum sp. TaxID=1969727 RepID=UPI002D4A4119|nr:NAD(P)/FAD-dependent oxidoreductase [Methylocaldum sp.]HYE35192.1 NAD(P)/FAD-dependent oxidoreductase [Methylocaldum sp.]